MLMSNIVKTIKPIRDNLLNNLISIEEIIIIKMIAEVEYKRCLLKNINSLLIENDKTKPIVMIMIIIRKLGLSISFHHFEKKLSIYMNSAISLIAIFLN